MPFAQKFCFFNRTEFLLFNRWYSHRNCALTLSAIRTETVLLHYLPFAQNLGDCHAQRVCANAVRTPFAQPFAHVRILCEFQRQLCEFLCFFLCVGTFASETNGFRTAGFHSQRHRTVRSRANGISAILTCANFCAINHLTFPHGLCFVNVLV